MTLEGKVVGVTWQDHWWETEEKNGPHKEWLEAGDKRAVHTTYGLVIRDTDDWITVSHEWRPGPQAVGATSIVKACVRSIEIYGERVPSVQKAKRKR